METLYIGNNILAYLKERNKTQVDLANGLNTSKQVINKIIKGKKAIRTEELIAISEYLNVSLEDLVKKREVFDGESFDSFNLYGDIKSKKTAEFILELVNSLSDMEEELAAHGISD